MNASSNVLVRINRRFSLRALGFSDICVWLPLGIYVLSLLLVRPFGDFPLLDDWVYARSSSTSAMRGQLAFTGYESAWTIPQIALGAIMVKLVGVSHLGLRVVSVVSLILCVGIANSYFIKGGMPARMRVLLAGLIIFNPVVYLLSVTFMSDLPFLALWIGACFAWDSAISTGRKSWLPVAVTCTSLALAQRQFGLLIPLSVLALVFMSALSSLRYRRALPAGTGPLFAAVLVNFLVAVALYLWMRSKGQYQPPLLWAGSFKHFVPSNFKMIVLLCLALLPLCALVATLPSRKACSSIYGAMLSLLVVLCCAVYLISSESIFFGNLLSSFGIARPNELLLGERPVVIGPWSNRAAMTLGVLAFCLTIPAFLKSLAHFIPAFKPLERAAISSPISQSPFGAVLVGSTMAYLAMFSLRGGFDRYLIPTLPGLLFILGHETDRASQFRFRFARGVLGLGAVVSVAISYDYFRWNETKWLAAQELVAQGAPSSSIHAGYEWHGWNDGETSPIPGELSPSYNYAISFSESFENFSVVAEKPWFGSLPPFKRRLFVLVRNK